MASAKKKELSRLWRLNNPDKIRYQNKRARAKLLEKDPSYYKRANKKSYKNKIQKFPTYNADRHLKHTYKISLEERNKLFETQGNVCAICKFPYSQNPDSKFWHLDHCHNTEIIRGVLCHRCNLGLGHFKDSTLFLEEAIKYLKRFT